MTHFNEMDPSPEDTPKFTDPIITTNDDGTWAMEWRSDEDTAPVHRIILETMFQIHNRYVLSHPRRTHDERMASLQATRASLEGRQSSPVGATGARAVLERLEALEARLMALEVRRLTRAITCPNCAASWGAVAPIDELPLTIACPFCTMSFTI